MPPRKTKRSKSQYGGWFWEQSDPVFGKSNKWLATQAGYIDDDLKQSKRPSKAVSELMVDGDLMASTCNMDAEVFS
jgi:hypothetical protein